MWILPIYIPSGASNRKLSLKLTRGKMKKGEYCFLWQRLRDEVFPLSWCERPHLLVASPGNHLVWFVNSGYAGLVHIPNGLGFKVVPPHHLLHIVEKHPTILSIEAAGACETCRLWCAKRESLVPHQKTIQHLPISLSPQVLRTGTSLKTAYVYASLRTSMGHRPKYISEACMI